MQKFLSVLAGGLLLAGLLQAQEHNTATIVYEKKTNVHRNMTDERLKNYVPEFKTAKFELKLQANKWQYKNYVELENPDNTMPETEGRVVIVSTGGGESEEFYYDYANQKVVRIIEIGSNTYNLKDSLKKFTWTITQDTATIAGYLCTKATTDYTIQSRRSQSRSFSSNGQPTDATASKSATDTFQKAVHIEAWFTAKLASNAGPENYNGLPGTILYLNMNNGEQVFTPVAIDTKSTVKTIKEPTRGKKITKEELATIQRKMFENLQQGRSFGGTPVGGVRIVN